MRDAAAAARARANDGEPIFARLGDECAMGLWNQGDNNLSAISTALGLFDIFPVPGATLEVVTLSELSHTETISTLRRQFAVQKQFWEALGSSTNPASDEFGERAKAFNDAFDSLTHHPPLNQALAQLEKLKSTPDNLGRNSAINEAIALVRRFSHYR